MFYTVCAWFTPWERRFPKSTKRISLDSSIARVKAPQIRIALQILERRIESIEQLRELAKWADALSALNVRSRGRRQNHAAMVQGFVSRND